MCLVWLLLSICGFIQANTLDCVPGTSRSELSLLLAAESACPSFIVDNYTVHDYPLDENTTIESSVQLDGYVGYCTQIPVTGHPDTLTSGTFNYTHHINIILQIPWCYNSLAFGGTCGIVPGRYPSYPAYYGPAVIINERPLQQECLDYYSASFNTTYQPFPLWDVGSDTLGTIRIAVNDSCLYNSSFLSPFRKPLFKFLFLLSNGSYSLSNNSVIDPSQSPFIDDNNVFTNSSGKMLYSSYARTTTGLGGGRWCTDQCNTFPQATCLDAPRTIEKREIFRQRSIVSLACKDMINGFGFVWRVENRYSLNIHFDWFITDIIQNVTLSVATNTTYINISAVNQTLNVGYDDGLYNGFWPGVAGKRRVAALQYFYIPTYTPSSNSNTSLQKAGKLRPTLLRLYAGYPDHYVGTTTLAGIVDFFDMRTILNMAAFIEFNTSIVGTTSPGRNATYKDKNVTTTIRFNENTMDLYIPKDYDRQIILAVCQRSENLTATLIEIISITTVNGWNTLCKHINNSSKTWAETLVMLYDTFPGILATNTTDPIPQCNCSNEERSPCTSGSPSATSTPNETPNMVLPYAPGGITLTVNASVGPVCRITSMLLDNITKTLTNPPMTVFIYNATAISDGDYGYVWQIRNNNIDPNVILPGLTPVFINSNNDLYVRWAFGTYTPPAGNANTTYPLPYPSTFGGGILYPSPIPNVGIYIKTQDVTIRAATTTFFFSLASTPHKMYGTFQQICQYSSFLDAAAFCQSLFPQDPIVQPNPYGWSIDANNSTLNALPDCECGVNVPCELGNFIFSVDNNLNFSTLVVQPPQTLPPLDYAIVYPNCVPSVELCNGRDDDCNGLIDDIPGYSYSCGLQQLNGVGICTNGNLACPTISSNPELTFPAPLGISYQPVCFGEISPQQEICNMIDDNCDNIIDNITPNVCGGYTLGVCRQGYSVCSNGTQICYGEIQPITEICGDNLDNDCDGVIDNGCPIILQIQNNANGIQYLTTLEEKAAMKTYETNRQSHNLQNKITKVNSFGESTNKDINSMLIDTSEDPKPVDALNILNDVSNYAIAIYTSIWTIVVLLCLVVVLLSVICLFGPHGGFCMWGTRFTNL